MADSFDLFVDVRVTLIDLYEALAPVGGLFLPGSGLPLTVPGNDCAVWIGLSDSALEDYNLDNRPDLTGYFRTKPQSFITTERSADFNSIVLAGNCSHILFMKWPRGVMYLRNNFYDVSNYKEAIAEWKLISSSRLH